MPPEKYAEVRDKDRIPKILKEIERVWTENPDFRLGQLIVAVTKPKDPCPEVFYIEDEKLLEGLKRFEDKSTTSDNNQLQDWKKYSNVSRVDPNELTPDLLIKLIEEIKIDRPEMVVTPIELMRLNGAPVADQNWLITQKTRIKKLQTLLLELSKRGILKSRKSKQDYKGVKETGYNIA